jgi:hypothetical protein
VTGKLFIFLPLQYVSLPVSTSRQNFYESKAFSIIRNLHRGINDFKKGYQPRNTIVNIEKGDLVADCHSVATR